MTTPDEFKHKITISMGLAVAYTVVLISTTFTIGRMMDNDEQREEMRQHLEAKIKDMHQFSIDEVSGLRSDWERDRAEQNRRIEKMEEKLNK